MKNYLHIGFMVFIQTVSLVSYVVNFEPFGFNVNLLVKTKDSPFFPLRIPPPPQFFLRISEKHVFPYSSSSLFFIMSPYFFPNYGLQIIYSSFKLKKPTSNPAAGTAPTSGIRTCGCASHSSLGHGGAAPSPGGPGEGGPPHPASVQSD